jgi:hypothetical protein
MDVITLLLLLVALVLFLLAAFNVPARVNLIAFGLACWVAVSAIAAMQALH